MDATVHHKLCKGLSKVFEMRFGTYEDSYDNLPRIATIAMTYYDVMEGGPSITALLIGVDGNNQVAFAFVENENVDSWYWFLERVKTNVVSSRSNAFWNIRRNRKETWKWCFSSVMARCALPMNKDLRDLFKTHTHQQRKFNAIWKLLDEFQTATSSARVQGQWIQDKPKEKWALLYDTNGRRYGIMTTNHQSVLQYGDA
ncbi:hypothetical protein U9M48_009418 [Paspalum notatum var. saurae]|uniref:MULE transposase domain-containing protein n=1 Tax=Paspalum notatum var. saurae TaxID=547442 RepID=A0AAQ3SRF4_PASNO